MKLIIDKEALQEMHRHAEADYPNECCGFFYGLEGDVRRVRVIREVENAKEGDQRRRFEIDPLDDQMLYAIDQFVLAGGHALVFLHHHFCSGWQSKRYTIMATQ